MFNRSKSPAAAASGVLRSLVWLYFWLLVFEGAVRKWILPEFSGPLLIIRDPVLLLCYVSAMREGCFPRDGLLITALLLGAVALAVSSLSVLLDSINSTLAVTAFGFRANFLHLPLMFVIAQVLTRADVEKIGKWLLLISAPMALLVFVQFESSPDAWVNVGAGSSEGGQIGVAVAGIDKIRPPGLFSYNTGLASFVCLAAAFVLFHFVRGKVFPRWLGGVAAGAVLVIAALSISRSTAVSLILVGAAVIVAGFLRPEFLKPSLRVVAIGAGLWLALGMWAVFGEGLSILQARVGEAEGIKVGLVQRFFSGFLEPFAVVPLTPLFGYGLGVGTNVGASLLTGSAQFLLAEGEWTRVVMEMGPILGFSYLLLRLALSWKCVAAALVAVRAGDILPLLLCSASVLLLINGSFGQPTALGFAVFGAGLTLAAAKRGDLNADLSASVTGETATPIVARGRSRYAETLRSKED